MLQPQAKAFTAQAAIPLKADVKRVIPLRHLNFRRSWKTFLFLIIVQITKELNRFQL